MERVSYHKPLLLLLGTNQNCPFKPKGVMMSSALTEWSGKDIVHKVFDPIEAHLIFDDTRRICDEAHDKAMKKWVSDGSSPQWEPIKVSDESIFKYILLCSYVKLNPLKKQIYPMPTSAGVLNTITSIEGLRA